MAQRNIDFGSFPDDPQADAIRTAFQKVQDNFTEVYAGAVGASVISVNRTPGAGITVSAPTGNVIITANIACVQVHTSTLSIGRDSNGAQDTSITASSQTLWVDLPANISNVSNINLAGYATANGNITGGNINTAGQVVATGNVVGGNLVTTGTVSAGNLSSANLSVTGNISVTGNATVGNISGTLGAFTNVTGNGSGLSSITGANVTGTVPSSTTAGTVTTAAQPNITSVGTLSSLAVTANVTAGNVYANSGTIGASLLTGTLTTAAQPNVTSVGTLTSLGVNGTVTAVNITANTGVITGNGAGLSSIPGANVTGTVPAATTATTATSATTAGTVTTAAQPNITSVGTLTGLTVTSTITGNINGSAATATSATTAGTVTTAAQPNITSVGTLSGLTVTGTVNATGASNVSLGAIGNIKITGGALGYTIKTDGAGNLSWGIDTAAAGGSNTEVQFNDAGSLGGSANYTFNKSTNQLTVSGNIQASNADLGNAVTANYFTGNFFGRANTANTVLVAAQPNITSLGTLTSLTVAGGTANLGNVGNVKILGGSGYLYNDSSNNLSYQSVVTQAIPGVANTLLLSTGSNNIFASGNIKFNDPQLDITGTLNVSGNANVGNLNAGNITGTITTASQPNITSVGTLAGLTVSSAGLIVSGGGNINAGNITATNVISGNGSGLTNIAGANVTGTVANATYANSAGSATTATTATSATTAGTVTTAAQPNITSVGTLTSLGVNGTITGVNITANTGVITGNGAGLTTLNASNISSGTLAQARLANSSLTVNGTSISLGGTGTITAANPNALTLGTYLTGTSYDGSLAVTAAVDATTTNTASKVVARDTNGSFSANIITATLSGSATSATTAGTVTTAAQPNITSVGTLTSLAVTGNISAANITGTHFGSGAALSSLTGANVTGTVSSATNATTAGTVTTAAQPNITSVGTLTSLTSSGNIQGVNLISTTGYQIRSVATGITAAGSSQGTATGIARGMNIVSTVSSGANGVVLPTAVAGMVLTITNTTANSLIVYPASGAQINSLGTNAGFTQGTTTIQFIAPTTSQWYTVGATYA